MHNLIVKDLLGSDRNFKLLIKKCREIYHFFHFNGNLMKPEIIYFFENDSNNEFLIENKEYNNLNNNNLNDNKILDNNKLIKLNKIKN